MKPSVRKPTKKIKGLRKIKAWAVINKYMNIASCKSKPKDITVDEYVKPLGVFPSREEARQATRLSTAAVAFNFKIVPCTITFKAAVSRGRGK